MPGVAQVWLTANELHALVQVSTHKDRTLSPRMAQSLLPKLEEARLAVGCPVPFARPELCTSCMRAIEPGQEWCRTPQCDTDLRDSNNRIPEGFVPRQSDTRRRTL